MQALQFKLVRTAFRTKHHVLNEASSDATAPMRQTAGAFPSSLSRCKKKVKITFARKFYQNNYFRNLPPMLLEHAIKLRPRTTASWRETCHCHTKFSAFSPLRRQVRLLPAGTAAYDAASITRGHVTETNSAVKQQ